jgi:hypothetical protein
MLTINDVTRRSARLACFIGLLVFAMVGCGDLSSGPGGTGGGGTGGGGTPGTGGMPECESADDCDDGNECTEDTCADGTCDSTPVEGVETVFFNTAQAGVEGPLEGVRICEVGTTNCTTSNEAGRATLELPRCQEVAWTLEKEGYTTSAAGDVTDDTFEPATAPWAMTPDELWEGWAKGLGISYPLTGTHLRVLPQRAGVTFEMIGEAATPSYADEAGTPTFALSATTTRGDGGFAELAPGEVEVVFGGTATDCVAARGWPSDKPNAIRVPIIDGVLTFASMSCGAP